MTLGVALLALAGFCQMLVAGANWPAARILDYRGQLQRVTPMVRHVFQVQNLYIELVLFAQALLCWVFPQELLGSSRLGQCLSLYLALFWGLRWLIQMTWYDRAARRQYRAVDIGMIVLQVYLTSVFGLAASGIWKA